MSRIVSVFVPAAEKLSEPLATSTGLGFAVLLRDVGALRQEEPLDRRRAGLEGRELQRVAVLEDVADLRRLAVDAELGQERCTQSASEIGDGTPTTRGATLTESVPLAWIPKASVTVTTGADVPACTGVPEIAPLEPSMASPAGSPLAENEYGGVPPEKGMVTA